MVFYFSATAPQFTKEEEQKERETLTKEEKEEIEFDIRCGGAGSNSTFDSDSLNRGDSDSSLDDPYDDDAHHHHDHVTTMQVDETTEMKVRGIQLLKDAMDMIEDLKKREYVEACTKVPHLVERESNPLSFLRGAKYDAWVSTMVQTLRKVFVQGFSSN